MISEKTYSQIEKDGLKNDFKIGRCGGELDGNGDFVFVIRLLPTGNRLAKIRELTQHDPPPPTTAGFSLISTIG